MEYQGRAMRCPAGPAICATEVASDGAWVQARAGWERREAVSDCLNWPGTARSCPSDSRCRYGRAMTVCGGAGGCLRSTGPRSIRFTAKPMSQLRLLGSGINFSEMHVP